MNFDGSELTDEDGSHPARRRRILGGGRATVLRQLRVRRRGGRQGPAHQREQRAPGEPEKARTGQSGLRQALKTGVT